MTDFLRGIQSLFAELRGSAEGGYSPRLMAWAMQMPPLRPAPPFQLRKDSGNMILSCSEVGMGGPESCDYMLADGAIIKNVSSGWNSSADQRYAAAVTDARNSASFVVYDRHEHVCYHYDKEDARDIFDRLFSATIDGRYIKTRQRVNDTLPRVLKEARAVPYAPYRGLWLDPCMANRLRDDVMTADAPGPALSAVLHAPPDLRTLEDPLGPITHPRWQLHLDGQPSGCWCVSLDTLMVSADGDALIVGGTALDEDREDDDDAGELWHAWTRSGGWMSIDRKMRDRRGHPAGVLAAPSHISAKAVVFELPRSCEKRGCAWTRTTGSTVASKVNITMTAQGVRGELTFSPDTTG